MNKHPSYIDTVTPITLYDELAEFLGAVEGGLYTVSYWEIAKMAGHSCATVAGAWLMADAGLKALYGEEIPRRGEIKVELKNGVQEKHAGVVGMVLTNITGATRDDGFGGIPGGRFDRTGLLHYKAPIETDLRLTRLDTGASVGINYRPGKVVDPMSILMSAIGPEATEADKASFPRRFQEMVATVFVHRDEVIEVQPG
jgi:hypothetical protein